MKKKRHITDVDSSALMLHRKHLKDARNALDQLRDTPPRFSNYEKLLLDIQELKAKTQDYEDIIFRCDIVAASMDWLWNEHDMDERQTIGFQNSMYLLIDALKDTIKYTK